MLKLHRDLYRNPKGESHIDLCSLGLAQSEPQHFQSDPDSKFRPQALRPPGSQLYCFATVSPVFVSQEETLTWTRPGSP